MAKKNTRPEFDPRDDNHEDQETPIDETVRIDGDESASEQTHDDVTEKELSASGDLFDDVEEPVGDPDAGQSMITRGHADEEIPIDETIRVEGDASPSTPVPNELSDTTVDIFEDFEEPESPESDHSTIAGDLDDEIPIDETIRVDGDGSAVEPLSGEVTESEQSESTIVDDADRSLEGPDDGQPSTIQGSDEPSIDETVRVPADASAPTGQSTVVPESFSTLIPAEADQDQKKSDDNATVRDVGQTVQMRSADEETDGENQSPEAEATVGNLDSTLRMGSADEEETVFPASSDSEPAKVDPNKITVGPIDKTVAIDLSPEAKARPTVRSGLDSNRDSDVQSNTTAIGSILDSPNISQTVNPRELSDQDATHWNSAVGSQEDPSQLPPAIDRTFSDKQFDRLRKCNVAELKSDVTKTSDYRLVRKLGQGGMGDVFVARQGSLDRLLALKLIKPLTGRRRTQLIKTGKLKAVEEERRQQFLSEAIVTGDLDHPNIVPIHDVALTSDNELFYSMKRVVGTPWSDVIKEKSRDENIDILMKTSDAIAFAHTRGVVHRDIKPENIMLGDFGVVLVMDWGLALPTSQFEKQDSIFSTSGLGGTPAFMAPEMAAGPLAKIGPASDIYLLGATLFLIVTGQAPHHGKNVTECLRAVHQNVIRKVAPEKQGELLDIALKAMATNPEDRYPDVASFQQAIRDYRSHAESIALASRAGEDLEHGKETGSYEILSRAAFRFQESIDSWDGNSRAKNGLAETKLVHADAAYQKGDFDLGLSLLDEDNAEHQPIIQKLRNGIRERDSHASRLALMRKVAVAMLAFIIVGGAVAFWSIYKEKQKEAAARQVAELAEQKATAAALAAQKAEKEERLAKLEEQRAKEDALAAKEQEQKAKLEEQKAKEDALAAKELERKAKEDALAAKELEREAKEDAEKAALRERLAKEQEKQAKEQLAKTVVERRYEGYVARIGLAKARLERNEADGARAILEQIRRDSPDKTESWEWQWLWKQANQSESSQQADAAILDLQVSLAGRHGIVALSGGGVELVTLSESGEFVDRRQVSGTLPAGVRATSVAIAPNESSYAIGTATGQLFIVSSQGRAVEVDAHVKSITDLQYSPDGLLISASADKTIRVWDPNTSRELTRKKACWHISPVRQIAVARADDALILAAAVSDDETGRVAIWELKSDDGQLAPERRGTLSDQHRQPVSAVAMSIDGRRVASGDVAGNVFLWDRDAVRRIDYRGNIKNALANLNGVSTKEPAANRRQSVKVEALIDSSPKSQRRLVSTAPTKEAPQRAHDDVVKAIRFSLDGKSLITSSDDFTLKLWDSRTRTLSKTLKGHGGWVVGADFWRGRSDVVISGSNDASLRTWRPGTYVGAFVVNQPATDRSAAPKREAQAHEQVICSASFSPDGTKVLTASHDHTARIMEIDPKTLAFKELVRLQSEVLDEGTPFVAMSLQLDRPHQRLYIGSADATIRFWDLKRGTQVGEVSGTGLNTSFSVSQNGRLMLTGSSSPDDKALLWKLDPQGISDPAIAQRLQGHEQVVTALAISPDSKLLFTGDRSGYGVLWDAKTGEPFGSPLQAVQGYRINAAQFSSDSTQLMIAADNEQVVVIDVESRDITRRLSHDGYVTQLSLSSDGSQALTVSESISRSSFVSTATLWDLRSGESRVLDQVREERSGSRAERRITSARFDDSGQMAAISRSNGVAERSSVGLWDVERVWRESSNQFFTNGRRDSSGKEMVRTARAEVMYQLPQVLGTAEAIIPIDDREILTMNKNGAFKWDQQSERLIKSYRAHSELTEASFSFDGKYVATGSRSVKIWDAESGIALAKLESPLPIRSVQFAPKAVGPTEYVFATGGDDGITRTWIWDAAKREVRLRSEAEKNGDADEDRPTIRRVRFAPSGSSLLVVGDDGLAQLLNADNGKVIESINCAPDVDLISAAFSTNGKWIASGGKDKRVWIKSVANLKAPPIWLEGHADQINDVSFLGNSDDDMRIMTASSDDSARVWDPRVNAGVDANEEFAFGREIISLRRHTGDVNSVDVTNGGLLMTAGSDGLVILWPTRPQPPAPALPPPENLFDQLGEGLEDEGDSR